jgi:hypothetical protein
MQDRARCHTATCISAHSVEITVSGAEVNLAENIDKNLHSIDGGVPASLTGLNSAVAIDPNNLPGQQVSNSCTPLWPHNFIRTNTVFGVLHKHGLRTAWSDKHPAYDIVNGNEPKTQPTNGPGTNVDDFFAPEINSDLTPANVALISTLLGPNFSTAPAPTSFPPMRISPGRFQAWNGMTASRFRQFSTKSLASIIPAHARSARRCCLG